MSSIGTCNEQVASFKRVASTRTMPAQPLAPPSNVGNRRVRGVERLLQVVRDGTEKAAPRVNAFVVRFSFGRRKLRYQD